MNNAWNRRTLESVIFCFWYKCYCERRWSVFSFQTLTMSTSVPIDQKSHNDLETRRNNAAVKWAAPSAESWVNHEKVVVCFFKKNTHKKRVFFPARRQILFLSNVPFQVTGGVTVHKTSGSRTEHKHVGGPENCCIISVNNSCRYHPEFSPKDTFFLFLQMY